jgi:pimeloyl-ACP methyl ester carboxylesterase
VGGPAVVFGHSLGGEIAVMFAAKHPELVRALIVGDASLSIAHHATEEPAHRARNVLWHSLCGRSAAEIEVELRRMPFEGQTAEAVMGREHVWFGLHAETLHELDPDMLAAVLAGPEVMLEGYDPHVLLPRITCPTLLVQADPNGPLGGGLLRDDEVELALRLMPNVRRVRLEGVGHPLNDVAQVMAAMQPFLDELSASGRTRSRATG